MQDQFVRDALLVQQGEVRPFLQFPGGIGEQVPARPYGAVQESVRGGRAWLSGVE
jgi:hypothetical protein